MNAPIAPGIVTSLSPFKVQIGSDAPGGQPCQRVAPAQIGQRGGVLILGGQRVWLGQYDKNDIDVSGLTARISALESPDPWVACALSAGFTGAAWVRKLGPSTAEITASINGTFPQGNTSPLVVIPAAYLPTLPSGTDAPRLAAYLSGGYECIAWVAAVGLGVTQRTGAARTGVQVRGTYGL